MYYAFFDGDSIGDKLEILLTENRINEARNFSESIKIVFAELEKYLRQFVSVEIVIMGGDDLLIRCEDPLNKHELLEEIRAIFYTRTSCTMSCGVGRSAAMAVRNLYLAKLYGKNRVYEGE
jgi:hypothetical protein